MYRPSQGEPSEESSLAPSSSLHVFNASPNNENDADENGIPITRSQPARFRRVHTKSRSGCLTCKSRKVRCDETRPACQNCTRRELRCKYSIDQEDAALKSSNVMCSAGSKPPSIANAPETARPYSNDRPKLELKVPTFGSNETSSSSDLQRAELFLMHHYDRCTSRTLMYDDNLWALDVPALAFEYDFVLHAMLTISAAHLRFLHSDVSNYSTLELHHLSKALLGLQEALNNPIDTTNADALLACSMLLVVQSWSWLDEDKGAFTFATDGLLPLNKGMMKVVIAVWDHRHQSIFKNIMDTDGQFGDLSWAQSYRQNWTALEPLFPNADIYAAPEEDHSAEFIDSPEQDERATANALRRLLPIIEIIIARSSHKFSEARTQQTSFHLRAWPVVSAANFVRAIQDENKKALVVLGYYYAAVARWTMIEERHRGWWVVRRSNYWSRAIVERLNEEYSEFLVWPREVVSQLEEDSAMSTPVG